MTSPTEIQVLHVDPAPDFAERTAKFLQRKDERISVQSVTNPGEGNRRRP
ncbi:hypothetical protein [Halodesulfurarchaeum sp.]